MYTNPAIDIAQYLISRADESMTPMTPMKLNILTYFCHGWMLATHGKPLAMEPVVAKRFGPCVTEVSDLAQHGKLPAPDMADDFALDAYEAEIADEVYNAYGGCSDLELFQLIRDPSSPWRNVWSQDDSGNAVIEDDLIQDHYLTLVGHAEPAAMCA